MRQMSDEQTRAAIERELRLRLDHDRAKGGRGAQAVPRAQEVRLECLTCNGVCASDARFCVHCGTMFNATVLMP